jgi:hypothetical protein
MTFRIIRDIGDLPHAEPVLVLATAIDGDLRPPLSFAQKHERGIDADPGEPGGKLGSAIEALQVDKGAQEGVLQRIFRVFAVARDAVNRPHQGRGMTLTKRGERRVVSAHGCGYQVFVSAGGVFCGRYHQLRRYQAGSRQGSEEMLADGDEPLAALKGMPDFAALRLRSLVLY